MGTQALSWLFSLHNDHRIPIQKLMHILLLRLSEGDFRILIALNAMTLAATSVCWILLSRAIHKRFSWSEIIVPGILLSFGFNTLTWGFSFQFLSGLFFLSLANLMWVRSVESTPKSFGSGAFLFPTICAWCGGNGLITSTVVGFGFFVAIFYTTRMHALSLKVWFAMMLWAANVLTIWILWESSSATNVITHNEQYMYFAFEMSKSWLGVFAIGNNIFKIIFSSLITFISVLGGLFFLLRPNPKGPRLIQSLLILPVLLSGLQSIALVAAITISRAGAQPWWPGLELHYGYLVTMLPLSAWIILAYVTGMITAFLLAKLLVFKNSQQPVHHSVIFFVLVNIVAALQTWAISMSLAYYYLFPSLGITRHIKEISHAIGVAVPVFISYIGHKRWSFR